MQQKTAHIAEWKYREVDELTDILTNHPVIGIVDIGEIPAPQLQEMRKNLRGKTVLRTSKNTLIRRALDKAEENRDHGINELKETVQGQTMILGTDLNPFKLYQLLQATRTKAPAKGGETAEEDIQVTAGETPFKPGPVVGELQKAGIPAAIEGGKVVIKKDKTIVPEGETINPEIAKMLTRMDIYPIEIGMGLRAAFEDGTVFTPDILDVDVDEYRRNIGHASGNAMKLALELAWATPATAKILLQQAYHKAFSLAVSKNIATTETVQHLISKAHRSMLTLASQVPETQEKESKNKEASKESESQNN